MDCANCGALLRPTAKVCIKCGTPVVALSTETGPAAILPASQNTTVPATPEIARAEESPAADPPPEPVYIKKRATANVASAKVRSDAKLHTGRPASGAKFFAIGAVSLAVAAVMGVVLVQQLTSSSAIPPAQMSTVAASPALNAGPRVPAQIAAAPGPSPSVQAPPRVAPATVSERAIVPVIVAPGAPGAPAQTAGMNARQMDPSLIQALAAAANNQWSGADMATAVPLVQTAQIARNRPRARAANEEGKLALQQADYAAAIEAFARGVAADPADPEVVNNLAFAHLESGSPAASFAALNDALRLAPRRVSAWANLSTAFAGIGEEQDSQKAMALALHFSGNRQRTLDFLADQQQTGHSDAFRRVASAVLATAADIPTLNEVKP